MKLRAKEPFGLRMKKITFKSTDEAQAAFELLFACIEQPRSNPSRILELYETFRSEAFRVVGEEDK